jgi:transmembrane sensor
MRAAGAWLARRDRGFAPAEQDAFAQWLDADPRHAAAVAQLEQTMLTFDRVRELAPAGAWDRAPDPDALAPRRPPRPRWRVLAGAGLATTLAAAAVVVLVARFSPPGMDEPLRLVTHDGGADRMALADGSVANLNRNSEVLVHFTAAERRLQLVRGEAHFEVAPNPARPFVVSAGGVKARAVGTAFSVRLGADSVEVLVTEGRVQVAPTAAVASARDAIVLGANFHASIPLAASAPPTHVIQLTRDEVNRQLAWQPRLRDLSNVTLAAAVEVFNASTQGTGQPRLVIGDPSIAMLRIGGSVYLEQTEPFVRLLEKSLGLRAERRGDTLVLLPAP